jgi:hypothetical protein
MVIPDRASCPLIVAALEQVAHERRWVITRWLVVRWAYALNEFAEFVVGQLPQVLLDTQS